MSLLPMKCNFVRWVLMLSPLWIGIALEQSSLAQPTTVPPSSLPKLVPPESNDWLVGPTSRKSGIFLGNHPSEIVLDNGLIRRTFLTSPNLATVGFDQLTSGESILRSVRAECRIAIDGKSYDIGGLVGQPLQNFLRVDWYPRLQKDPEAFVWDGNITSGPITERMEWKKRSDWLSMDVDWPPKGIQVAFRFEPPQKNHPLDGVSVTVHYALYDGLPLIEKWFTLSNGTSRDIRINHFTAEILSCVEASSQVEDLAQPLHPTCTSKPI